MSRAQLLARVGIVVVIAGRTVSGQQPQAQITVGGGTATDAVGLTSRAITIAPSLSFAADPRVAFSLGGSGTKFDNQQWSLSALAGTAMRAPLGRHEIG